LPTPEYRGLINEKLQQAVQDAKNADLALKLQELKKAYNEKTKALDQVTKQLAEVTSKLQAKEYSLSSVMTTLEYVCLI
jgi:hypothetical protein